MPNMTIRIAQVIKSCETIAQLRAARKYLDLWYYGHSNLETRIKLMDSHTLFEREINRRIEELKNVQ